MSPAPTRRALPVAWRAGRGAAPAGRALPEETAVALTFDRETYAVMLATPADLEDFAVGFALTEGIVDTAAEITGLEVVSHALGMEVRLDLIAPRRDALTARRRHLAGPTGCGLCGIDSLSEAARAPRRVPSGGRFRAEEILAAMAAMPPLQALGNETRAVHAAALWHRGRGIVLIREDVGRHNALDKLAGAAARQGIRTELALLLLTSRVSVEMVQKAAAMGVPALAAVSAPTAHAVRLADDAGLTLVAIARADGFEVFAGAGRIAMEGMAHVA